MDKGLFLCNLAEDDDALFFIIVYVAVTAESFGYNENHFGFSNVVEARHCRGRVCHFINIMYVRQKCYGKLF